MKRLLVGCLIAVALVGCTNVKEVENSEAIAQDEIVSITEDDVVNETNKEINEEVEAESGEDVQEENNDDNLTTSGNASVDLQSVDSQLALIESKYDECVSDFEMEAVCQYPFFAITDFNRNGRLELVLTDISGSGAFSVSYFYEVSEDYNSFDRLMVAGDENYDSTGDFSSYNCFDCYMKDGTYYYLVEDYASAGSSCKGTTFYLYSFDDTVKHFEIGGYVVLETIDEQNDDTYHVRLYNSDEKLFQTLDEYYGDIDTFLSDYEKMPSCAVKWMSLNDEQPIQERLQESYEGFSLEASDSCVSYYTAIWGEDATYIIDTE